MGSQLWVLRWGSGPQKPLQQELVISVSHLQGAGRVEPVARIRPRAHRPPQPPKLLGPLGRGHGSKTWSWALLFVLVADCVVSLQLLQTSKGSGKLFMQCGR